MHLQPDKSKIALYSANGRGGSAACLSATWEPSARKYVSCLRSQQHSLQLSSPSPNSMRAAPSIGRHRRHQFTQQPGAFIAQSSISLEDQRPHGGSITFRFSVSPATVAAHRFDALSLQRAACGHRAGTCRSKSAQHPACSMSLLSVLWTARCGLFLAPPYLQQNGWNG